MKTTRIWMALFLAFALMASPVLAEEGAKPQFKEFHSIVDYDFVARHAVMPQPKGVMIIDSRPYKPTFVAGYIPTAVSIPTSQFEKMTDKLPADKAATLIFYCGGFHCPLSHKAAFMAEAMGYTDVHVYAAGYPDWKKKAPYHSIGLETVMEMMTKGEKYMLIDARPAKKFLEGAIPSSISIPEREFADKRSMLPIGKTEVSLVYYCGGYDCVLSHKSAVKARALGYKNVMVAEAGYPGWKELYGSAGGVAVKAGPAEGAIDTAQFQAILAEKPETIMVIDVRDAAEFNAGHLPGAVNMSVDMVEQQAATMPVDKPIVFVCATGARSGEAYYLFKDLRPEVENVYYLEATIKYGDNNSYEITPNK
jgi:rhodanese-related sulfurtransferase